MTEPLKIFIASSSELREEREKIVLVLHQINKCYKHLKLEAVKWETDIESGNYDKKEVQDEINPLLDNCRIIFVLFYSNVGKFTLREYQLAEEKKKKIFLYFKEGFSPKTREENTNYDKALLLKEKIEKENRTVYVEYETIDQFENRVRQDLNLYISRNYSPHQRKKNTEYNEYLANLQHTGANLEAATSETLFRKTVNHLDKKQLMEFFQQERVKNEFTGENLDTPEEKLSYLELLSGKNNLIKGTFLCLGNDIHEICKTASPSQFFVFEDTDRRKPFK